MQYAYYTDPDHIEYLGVIPTIFPMDITTGIISPIRTKTVGGVDYTYRNVTSNSVDYASIQDETTLLKWSPSVIPSTRDFWIKPDKQLQIKIDPIVTGGYACALHVDFGDGLSSGNVLRHEFGSGTYFSVHMGTFTVYGDKWLAIYYRQGDRQIYVWCISENFFDESERPETKSETGTVTPDGHWGTGKTTKGNMVFVNYAAALSRVNTGTHGLRMYDVGEGAVNALYERLWSQDTWDKWANRKFSPIGGILSLHRVPLAAPTAGTVSSVTIAGQQYPVGSAALVSDNIAIRNFAEVQIPEIAGSFLDYAPYCSAMLYLPFIGSVSIDVNTISSGSIAVRYTFDLISGNCIAQVRTVDRDGSAIIYGTYAGNAAYKYPISGNDNGGFAVLGAAAGIATAGLAVAATGGSAAPLAASIVSGAASSISAEHHLQQAGSLPANTSALGDLRIYLVITRPAYLTPDGYENIKGYPAGDGHTVGSYTGLLSGELHADSIPAATDWEKKEIERLFAEGVII